MVERNVVLFTIIVGDQIFQVDRLVTNKPALRALHHRQRYLIGGHQVTVNEYLQAIGAATGTAVVRAALALVLILAASSASAQSAADCTGLPTGSPTPTGPTPRVQMKKSADHDNIVGGVAVLTSYAIIVCQNTTLRAQSNVGKPTPDTLGNIVFPVPITGLAKNTIYYVVVYALGPGGSNNTGAVSPFVPAGAPAVDGSTITILP